ncbi:MAG: FAD-dependent oxidoreductase, partial [Micromonosporaceae bacterium]|nr:FAD-dependent oxidoreductase [Micromonosporaceae bacterium]
GEYELVEASAGLRPGTPDNAPLLGLTADPRLIAATGHYRQGILLTPITGDAIAELLVTGEAPAEIAAFDPLRFAQTGQRHQPEEVTS